MSYELQQRCERATDILGSKGENRQTVEAVLAKLGIALAVVDRVNPRRLHRQ